MEHPNLSYIKKLSKGDVAFEKDILDIVKEELQSEINNYHQYFKENNLLKAKIFVHRIKHKMSILGLNKSYEITNTFENSFKNTELEHQEYFESMLPIMINYLKTV
jgi:hypothetical protein